MPKIMTLSGLVDVPEVSKCGTGEKWNDCLKICILSDIQTSSNVCRDPEKDDAIWYFETKAVTLLRHKDRLMKIRPTGNLYYIEPGLDGNIIQSVEDLKFVDVTKDNDFKKIVDWEVENFPQFEFEYKKGQDEFEWGDPILGSSFKNAIQEAIKILKDDGWWDY